MLYFYLADSINFYENECNIINFIFQIKKNIVFISHFLSLIRYDGALELNSIRA
jgi:hypothetical protein